MMGTEEPPAKRRSSEGREDPRPAQTRDLVLQAARLIVASEGQAAVTPTRLVEVSGVARSTIYRHWPDAAAIVADAAILQRDDPALRKTGDIEADLRNYLDQLRIGLESPTASIIAAQVDIAERDERAAETLAGNGRHRNKLIAELLDDPRTDFESVHALLVGPLFMQRFFTRRPIGDDLIEAIVEAYLDARPDSSAPQSGAKARSRPKR